MLTGRVPFNGETTVAIAIKHIQEEMPSPREYVPEIPVCVEQIVLKCTQKSPDRRYHSMAALIADLKKALMSPNEDFVQIENPDEAMATRTVTSRERKEINESRNKEATEGARLKKNETPQKPKKKKNSPSMKSRKRMKKMTRMRSTMTIPEWKKSRRCWRSSVLF